MAASDREGSRNRSSRARRWVSSVPEAVSSAWRSAGRELGLEFTDLPPTLRGRLGVCDVHAGRIVDASEAGQVVSWFVHTSYEPALSGFVIERRRKPGRIGRYHVPFSDPAMDASLKVTWEKVGGTKPDLDTIQLFLADPTRRKALTDLFAFGVAATVEHLSERRAHIRLGASGDINPDQATAVLDAMVRTSVTLGSSLAASS